MCPLYPARLMSNKLHFFQLPGNCCQSTFYNHKKNYEGCTSLNSGSSWENVWGPFCPGEWLQAFLANNITICRLRPTQNTHPKNLIRHNYINFVLSFLFPYSTPFLHNGVFLKISDLTWTAIHTISSLLRAGFWVFVTQRHSRLVFFCHLKCDCIYLHQLPDKTHPWILPALKVCSWASGN